MDDTHGPIILGVAAGESLMTGVQDVVDSRVSGSQSPGPSQEGTAPSMGDNVIHTRTQAI